MGMAIDDDLRIRKGGVEFFRCGRSQLITMSNHDVESVQLYRGDLGQATADVESIGIPEHGGDRSQGLKLSEEIEGSQISRMKDVIHLGKGIEDLGPEQAMGICDHAQPHQRASVRSATGRGPMLSHNRENAPRSSCASKVQWPKRSTSI